MDTTQKNREDAQQGRTAEKKKTAAPAGAVRKKPSAAPGKGKVAAKPRQAAAVKAVPKSAASARAGAPKTDGEVDERKAPAPAEKKKTPVRRNPRHLDVPDRKRAYGRSKEKDDSGINGLFKRTAQRKAQKEKEEKEREKKEAVRKQRTPIPPVVYNQPKVFSAARLVMQLITVVLVVAALVVGLSVFFKVEEIRVSGANVYEPSAIQEASGISVGDNLLTFNHASAAAKIQAELGYINSVRFGIKLPGTVNIIVDEAEVVYAIKDSTGSWWLMTSEGRIVEQANGAKAANHTQVLGVTLESPEPNKLAQATESAPIMETNADGETVPVVVTVTGAQRLNAALQILAALEANGIVGDAASVDVSRIEDIFLMYGSRYEVKLGDASRLDYKIACMNDAILQMSDYQSGVLDISFTIWPNQVGYTPFS